MLLNGIVEMDTKRGAKTYRIYASKCGKLCLLCKIFDVLRVVVDNV